MTLWNQRGSSVLFGNLLVLPVKDSIVYIQPLYLRAEDGKIPELKRVIVAYKNNIAMRDTLEQAIGQIFGSSIPAPLKPGEDKEPEPATPETPSQPESDLVREAREHLEKALEAQKEGDWSRYGEEIKLLEEVLKRAE